jgi:EpsI family protein
LGQIDHKKIIILCVCFALTSIFIYRQTGKNVSAKRISLRQALADVTGWEKTGFSSLDPKIVKALKLDDYTNQRYINGSDKVFLYIGYYMTTEKVGAAHDPMVCFYGQGWEITKEATGEIDLNPVTGPSIKYSSMIVQSGQKKELVFYWFQSYDKANPDTFTQKINMLLRKLVDKDEDNAFVRITTPIDGRSISECRETIHSFIKAFYPIFLEYIKNG